jgi:hypothetical protein
MFCQNLHRPLQTTRKATNKCINFWSVKERYFYGSVHACETQTRRLLGHDFRKQFQNMNLMKKKCMFWWSFRHVKDFLKSLRESICHSFSRLSLPSLKVRREFCVVANHFYTAPCHTRHDFVKWCGYLHGRILRIMDCTINYIISVLYIEQKCKINIYLN